MIPMDTCKKHIPSRENSDCVGMGHRVQGMARTPFFSMERVGKGDWICSEVEGFRPHQSFK